MGLEAPEYVAEPPPLNAQDAFYWQAYLDLVSERRHGGPIPWSAYAAYARYYRVDVDELRRVILPIDEKVREQYRTVTSD